VLLRDPPLTFREIMTHESLPLAAIFPEVLRWLGAREDAVLFGAQAVNAWVEPPRMTADIDLMSTDGERLAEALRAHLADRFHIAARTREAVPGGFRIYQVRKPKNRHLIDIRHVDALPEHALVEGVRVVVPAELAAMKVISMAARAGQPKAHTDQADLLRLLLAFPDFREPGGPVESRLRSRGATDGAMASWADLLAAPLAPDDDAY